MIRVLKIVVQVIWSVSLVTLGTILGVFYGWQHYGWLGAILLGIYGWDWSSPCKVAIGVYRLSSALARVSYWHETYPAGVMMSVVWGGPESGVSRPLGEAVHNAAVEP